MYVTFVNKLKVILIVSCLYISIEFAKHIILIMKYKLLFVDVYIKELYIIFKFNII